MRDAEPIPEISQIGVYIVLPSITESFHLLWLTANVLALPIFDVARKRRNLPIRIESYAIWRVDIDALHLAAQMLALSEARHYEQAVAEDHPVRPMLVVLVELESRLRIVESIEIRKQVGRVVLFGGALFGPTDEVIDDYFRMNFLLDVELGSLDNEIGPVLLCGAGFQSGPCRLRVIHVGPARGDACGMSASVRKRTCASCRDMSAQCQKRLNASQQSAAYSIISSARASSDAHALPRLHTARGGGDCYSFTLMPASRINFAHCGISDLILAAKSGGVLATISMPRCCRCLRASCCARTRAVSL